MCYKVCLCKEFKALSMGLLVGRINFVANASYGEAPGLQMTGHHS